MLYTISYMAGHGLTNTLTLHHAVNAKREFPLVMMMGSVGWIAAGWTVSWLDLEKSADMFRLASAAALAMGIYSFTLPHTPPKGAEASISFRAVLGIDALNLLRERSFATFIFCSFLICIPLSFYFNWMNVFMNELKIEDAAAKMTLGQVSDVVFLLLLPVLLPRLKSEGDLALGDGGLDAAVRALELVRRPAGRPVDAVPRHCDSRDVLRLHLRDGTNVRGRPRSPGDSGRRPGTACVRDAGPGDVHRFVAGRRGRRALRDRPSTANQPHTRGAKSGCFRRVYRPCCWSSSRFCSPIAPKRIATLRRRHRTRPSCLPLC